MKVLIACEFSGVVRNAFRELGHDAWSCDLEPDTENSPYHIQEDIRKIIDNSWDLMIAHPPCTYLTNAGVRHLHDRVTSRNGNKAVIHGEARMREMEQSAAFFNLLKEAPIPRIAVENPIPHGYARAIIGKYSQIIQPWMFGHGERKATCLWLKNLPTLKPTEIVTGRYARCHLESPGIKNGLTRAQRRSITYIGIAKAMAAQWGQLPQAVNPSHVRFG